MNYTDSETEDDCDNGGMITPILCAIVILIVAMLIWLGTA